MTILGSKGASGAYQAVIASMPAHETYIELFLGAGTIMKHKPRSLIDIGIEKDPITYAAARDVLEPLPGEIDLNNMCAFKYLNWFEFAYRNDPGYFGRVHIYADPPYLWSTRASDKAYRHEFNDEDHRLLIDIAKSLTAMDPGKITFTISGYPSSLYDSLLEGWRTYEYQVMTRGGARTEKLWMSYDQDTAHWHTFAGANFTERQRVRRKAQRWASNYAAMEPGERCAVMAAMLEATGTTWSFTD